MDHIVTLVQDELDNMPHLERGKYILTNRSAQLGDGSVEILILVRHENVELQEIYSVLSSTFSEMG